MTKFRLILSSWHISNSTIWIRTFKQLIGFIFFFFFGTLIQPMVFVTLDYISVRLSLIFIVCARLIIYKYKEILQTKIVIIFTVFQSTNQSISI